MATAESCLNYQQQLKRNNNKQKLVTCTYPRCDKAYTNVSHMKRHRRSHDSNGVAEFILLRCPYESCENVYQNKYSLRKHVRYYHELKEQKFYKCSHSGCGKQFKKLNKLHVHESVEHTGIPTLKCTIDGCHETFFTPAKLHSHCKKHKGYECKHCGSKCDNWSLLVKHNYIHHPKKYRCCECDAVFYGKRKYKFHMKSIHKGTSFKCHQTDCDKSYSTKYNLQQHVITKHEHMLFPCIHSTSSSDQCRHTFATKQSLRRHIDVIHRDSNTSKKQNKTGKACGNWSAKIVGAEERKIPVTMDDSGTLHESQVPTPRAALKTFTTGNHEEVLPGILSVTANALTTS